MSKYSHLPIYMAYGAAAATPDEFHQKERRHFDRLVRSGRIAALTVWDDPLVAYVSDNRWVADCVVCQGGIAVADDQDLWSCWDCGTTYRIVWPVEAERKDLEDTLRERVPRLRHWIGDPDTAVRHGRLPQTAQDLANENAAFGLDHHSWTTPRTWVASEIVTSAIMNTHIRDNLNETCPSLVTTAEDITVADGANSMVRIAKGSDNEYLRVISGSVEWST